jgi:BASS family bile acid:Na+ symporter
MLCVCLTAAASVTSVVTVPLFVNSALRLFASGQPVVQLPALTTPLALLAVSTLPVAAGMLLRRRRPAAARAVEKRVGTVGLAMLVFVAVAAFWSQRESLLGALGRSGGPALLLNATIVSLAWGIAAVAGLDRRQRIAVMLECALQNFALAAFVALTLLSDTAVLMPPLAYALLCYLPGCLIVAYGRRAAAAEARAGPAGAGTRLGW